MKRIIVKPDYSDNNVSSHTSVQKTEKETATLPFTTPTTTVTTAATQPVEIEPSTAINHSSMYIDGLSVDDVIKYFEEVTLSSEYSSNTENDGKIKKWNSPIRYYITGIYTIRDAERVTGFFNYLNSIDGFPGAERVNLRAQANFVIDFCTRSRLEFRFGYKEDSKVAAFTKYTFYDTTNEIYEAKIYFCIDNPRYDRESIVQEEILNSIGFSDDTILRRDSVIYQYSNDNVISPTDVVLLRILYNPAVKSGMTSPDVRGVIKMLYY